MSDAHMEDVLQELRAELDVTLSPEFAAKLRARVAETQAVSRISTWAMWGALAATAAAVIVVTAVRTNTPQPTSAPAVFATAAPPAVTERVPEVPVPAAPAQARNSPVRKPTAWRAEAPPARTRPWLAEAPPVIEVITNQPALIRLAFQRAAEVQREFPASEPVTPGPLEPLTLSKVVIDPIVIPGGADVPPPGGVSPVIRRVSAGDATRSPR